MEPAAGGRSGWRTLLTPRWVAGHLLVLAVVVSFSGFGAWQLDRHAQRGERNAIVATRLEAEPVSLEEALRFAGEAPRVEGDGAAVPALDYRRVRVGGRFDPEHELLRRPVARDGMPGFHIVTPLVLSDGSAVLVERGWVPQHHDLVPVRAAPPPQGEVTIRAWAFAGETPPTGPLAALAPRDPAEGRLTQAAYLDLDRLAPQMPYALQPLRLVLDAPERAPGDVRLPLPPRPPELTAGSHLGYAIQWYAFVAITVVGYAALLRRSLTT
jgi:surfeit locus 1 family protein